MCFVLIMIHLDGNYYYVLKIIDILMLILCNQKKTRGFYKSTTFDFLYTNIIT